jgi:hypothetical protein
MEIQHTVLAQSLAWCGNTICQSPVSIRRLEIISYWENTNQMSREVLVYQPDHNGRLNAIIYMNIYIWR